LAIVAGTVLRFAGIGRLSIWFDEGYTAWLVSHSPGEILRLVRADTAPPLYYLLLRYWIDLFGTSAAALRSLSAVLSVLALIVAVDVARQLLPRPPALAAAAWALALSFFAVWYAQEARAYSLMALLVVASVDCLLYHLRAGHRRWLIPLSIFFAAALYTHNISIAYAATLAALWLLPGPHPVRRRVADLAAAALLTAIVYLSWALWTLPSQIGLIRQGFWVHKPSLADVCTLLAQLCGVGHFWTWDQWISRFPFPGGIEHGPTLLAIILLGAAAMLSMGGQNPLHRRRAIALLAAALLPPALVAVFSQAGTPIFMAKTFLPSASLLPIFLMLPLAKPSRAAWAVAIASLLLIALSLGGYEYERQNEDWRGAAAIVERLPAARRLIVFVANEGQLPFDYYYPGTDPRSGAPAGFFDRDPPRTMLRVRDEQDLAPLQSRLAAGRYDEVVAVLSHLDWADPDGRTLAMLQRKFPIVQRWDLNDVKVMRLRRP
jgi:uncharacterized membrane protein